MLNLFQHQSISASILIKLIILKQYYVYILSNKSKTLYIGVTNNLERRLYEHKNKLIEGFTKRYNLTRLVYFEIYNEISQAIKREK